MLRELTHYRSFGSLSQICKVILCIGRGDCKVGDIATMVSGAYDTRALRVTADLALLSELSVCEVGSGSVAILTESWGDASSAEGLGARLADLLLDRMFSEGVLPRNKIEFDGVSGRYYMSSQYVELRYSAMRNLLIEAGFLSDESGRLYFSTDVKGAAGPVPPSFDGMTPEELLKKLEEDRLAGERAESYVMGFEKKRLGGRNADRIEQVSLLTISAGFDIASFENSYSPYFDRFIEVKAIGRRGFHISSGEIERAMSYRTKYYIYLVELEKTDMADYEPVIVRDPARFFKDNDEWRIVPDGFHITKI